MRTRLLLCAALVVTTLCLVKPWATMSRAPLQPALVPTLHDAVPSATTVVMAREEESEPVEVIDLSQLPAQTTELVALPELPREILSAFTVKPHAEEDPPGPTPVVPEFEVHAAFRTMVEIDSPGPSYPPVVYRPSPYHRDHPECPYLGGTPDDETHVRARQKTGGDEGQDAPAPRRPVRTGSGEGWLWKPF